MVIIAALSIEVAPLLDALKAKKIMSYSNKKALYKGGGHHVLITGVGEGQAVSTLKAYLNDHRPDRILNAGTAGLLDGSMSLFNIYHISAVKNECSEYLELVLLNNGQTATCLSVREPLTDPLLKKKYHREDGVTLTDMECYPLAKIANEEGISFSAIKIATDHADSDTGATFRRNIEQSAKKLKDEILKIINLNREVL
jgi:nucleoside phosphorylase